MSETILDKIIARKLVRLEKAKTEQSLEEIMSKAAGAGKHRFPNRFINAVSRRESVNIIAEFKRASPSKGIINDTENVAQKVTQYLEQGAVALSVLTEEDFFLGSINDLNEAKNAVDIPVLRKDFVLDEYQIYESALIGADAVLLIVAAMSVDELERFHKIASELGLDVLVEVHNAEEMKIAESIGAKIVGINNRNLKTFEVSLDVSRRLASMAPPNTVLISESGISQMNEISELRELGFSAFLIGETLMRGGHIAA